MAKATVKSSLAGKLGASGKKAFEGHKEDNTNYGGGGDLPAGIENGIAQLVDCKFDLFKEGDNKGEYYFYAAGTVISPKLHEGALIQGLRTSIMEAVCDTPNRSRQTIDEHIGWILNEFRKLGVDTKGIEFEDLEDIAAQLVEEAPYFRFRTWKGEPSKEYPNPRVNHQWKGITEYEATQEDDVQEATPTPKASGNGAAKPPTKEAKQEEPEEADWAALGEAADGGDEDAAAQLDAAAKEQGIDSGSIATWSEVAAMLTGDGAEGEEDGDEGSEEAPTPQQGEPYYYKPPRARKAIECEVTAVFKEKVNLKSLVDGKLFRGVPFGELMDQP